MRRISTLVLALAALGSVLVLACGGDSKPAATVQVELKEWTVSPSVTSMGAGKIRFVAKNNGTMIHELALLSVGSDGTKRELAEVEDVTVGSEGEFEAALKPGQYQLACLLVPGEAGSTVDHYQQGMHTDFTVR